MAGQGIDEAGWRGNQIADQLADQAVASRLGDLGLVLSAYSIRMKRLLHVTAAVQRYQAELLLAIGQDGVPPSSTPKRVPVAPST
eukprot:7126580-Alexandrium_andersonii.AAC.1